MSNGSVHNQEVGDTSRQRQPNGSPDARAALAGFHPSEWRRFRLLRCWLWLELPVAVAMFASVVVYAGVLWTDNRHELLSKLFDLVNPQEEANVPTWVNAGLWSIAGLIAGYIAMRVQEHRRSWVAVSALGVYFSFDETVQVHERLDDEDLTALDQLLPVTTYLWIIPAAVVVLVITGLLLRMVLALPRASRNGFLGGGAVFAFGSLVMEGIEGVFYFEHGLDSTYFVISGMIEEACEMTGVALSVAAMLHLLEWRRTDGTTAYRVSAHRPSSSSRG